MMNILLINHYAGSPQHGMEYRPYYLAREWVRMGHRVQIVACAQSHVRALQPYLDGQNRLDEVIDGIGYTWFAARPYAGNGVGRVRNIASFMRPLYQAGKQIAQSFNPDVVIASSTYPLDIWPAHSIARRSNAVLVFEVHDLWPLSPIEIGGMSRKHPFIMLVQAAEDYAYRHADVVVSMLPKVREHMESRGMAPHKLHIVPNGFDPEEWCGNNPAGCPHIGEAIAAERQSGKFIVGYTGSHGNPNGLDALLDAAKRLSNDRVAVVLVGDGHEKERLRQRVVRESIANVWMFDPVPKKQIPALLGHFDAAYVGAPKKPLYRFGVAPNKVLDYMMAGVPVIYAIEAGNDPVAEAECGLSVASEDPLAIADAIANLAKLPAEDRRAMGHRGRRHAERHYAYPRLAQKFLQIIERGSA
jgi:glycosyltransferase involved in cell wall biosynthesis